MIPVCVRARVHVHVHVRVRVYCSTNRLLNVNPQNNQPAAAAMWSLFTTATSEKQKLTTSPFPIIYDPLHNTADVGSI